MSKLVLLLLLTVSFPIWPEKLAQASAQSSATVTGVVLDPSVPALCGTR